MELIIKIDDKDSIELIKAAGTNDMLHFLETKAGIKIVSLEWDDYEEGTTASSD